MRQFLSRSIGLGLGSLVAVPALVAGLSGLPATPANAQLYSPYNAPYYRARKAPRSAERPVRKERQSSAEARRAESKQPPTPPKALPVAAKAAAPGTPPQPLVAVISLASQRINIFSGDSVIAQSRVSTGKSGHQTPTGVFSVLQRNRYHESNIYSGAPMPYMQRLTWSGIALHEGAVPNYPASHGCVRLPSGFANEMWGLGRIGMRVIVAPTDTEAVRIESSRLPQPVLTPVPESDLAEPVRTASITTASLPGSEPATRLLDPFRLAQVRKQKAAADRVSTEAAIKPALQHAAEASAEAARAGDELRRAEQATAAAESDLADKHEQIKRIQTDGPDSEIGKAIIAAEAALAAAQAKLTTVRKEEREKSDAAFDAARAVRAAEAAAEAAVTAARLANASVEPVTIFVSRKEGRVLVRQGFAPLLDEPIVIEEPEWALGTHVFTAMTASQDGASLGWKVVTVPSNPPQYMPPGERPRRVAKGQEPEIKAQRPHATAATALGRIELPEAVRKLVADRLWPGATLIISDFGVSNETGKGTDFIVLTQ